MSKVSKSAIFNMMEMTYRSLKAGLLNLANPSAFAEIKDERSNPTTINTTHFMLSHLLFLYFIFPNFIPNLIKIFHILLKQF